MNGFLLRFLRFVAVVDGRNNAQVRALLGCSHSTVGRFLNFARAAGMKVSSARGGALATYKVTDYGPFDVTKLRQMMGRKG